MIVLDTHVVSEAMKPEPYPAVQTWLNRRASATLYLSSVTVAELMFGIYVLTAGKRKDALAQMLDALMRLFRDRIIPFDWDAARYHAHLAPTAGLTGLEFPIPEGYIAAIAASRELDVASRETAPYAAARLTVINPWKA